MAMVNGGPAAEQILGKRLQAARKAAGFTQQTLCHRANLSYSTLAKIERGAIKSPSIFTIQSIAAALGQSLDELVGRTGLSAPSRSERRFRTKSGVRFVYFDVNGCLVRYYNHAFSQIAEDFAVPADIVESTFWRYNDDVCRGAMSISDFNRVFAERLGIAEIDWPKYYLAAAEPVSEMHDLLCWAREYFGVGLLTNIMPGLISAMLKTGQIPNITYDALVDSSEVGTIKPEKAIFDIAVQRAGARPEEILLIDDTRGNLNAADKNNWHVLWFDYAQPEESVEHIRRVLEPIPL